MISPFGAPTPLQPLLDLTGKLAQIGRPMGKRFYITTAIDYANGSPHLGHAYEKVLADVISRSRRSFGEEVFFLTGMDEHGQKVQAAAKAEGKTPQAYTDELAIRWRELISLLQISNDDFVRTTEPRHKAVVQAILSKLHEGGHFYKAAHSGWYSVKEETFLTEKDRNPDGTWAAQWGDVVVLNEENWYFKMGVHQAWLIEYIESHPEFIVPETRRNEVLGFLRNESLGDLCISRPLARLSWGIPIPFDPEYVTYVWFDALVNYFSVAAAHGDAAALEPLGNHARREASTFGIWPADVHLIGKDILKFHAVYWPIMLKALGASLPRTLLTHGWWQKDGKKLSKSTGNVVDPVGVATDWGSEAFRYYVVRELDIGPDGNWTDAGFAERYNSALANGIGNLLNRTINMLQKYRKGILGASSHELAAAASETAKAAEAHLREYKLQAALQDIWELVTRANQYVDQTAPFKLAKDPAQAGRLDEVLYNLAETSRVIAVLIWPFLPKTAERIFAQLRVCGEVHVWSNSGWGGLAVGHEVGQPEPLFPRRDLAPKASGSTPA
jgi:methionyl-tRNA synthetase